MTASFDPRGLRALAFEARPEGFDLIAKDFADRARQLGA
jgi:hypothetical protein